MMNDNIVSIKKGLSIEEALRKVKKGLEQIKYGEIIIKVENGKVEFIIEKGFYDSLVNIK